MHNPKKSDLHLNRFGVFPLLFMAMMICAFLWAPSVHAEEVPTTKTNYLTNDTYKDLGFSNLNDPAAFSSKDTSDPLEGYTPYILSELFVGQMNQNDDMADWTGNFKIFENVLTTENGSLNLNNMAKNLVGSVRNYWDMRNDKKMETQCKSTVALKPGNLTDADAATRPDVIIDNTLYCKVDSAFKENDSAQMLIAWSKNANGDYERGYGWSTTLDSGHWVGNIEASQQQGYLGMTVGDFDHDNYNEVAVYSPQDSGGKILFFRLELQSDQVTYRMYQEDYSISLSSLSGDFNLRNDVKRALVQLTTSQLSGQDELVVNVSMPYDNDANACKDGAIAIYDLSNTKSIKRTFFNRLSDGQTRFKSNAAVQGDVNGDGVDELIVTGNKNTGFSNNNKKGKGTISRNENLANILLWDKDKGYYFAWDSPKSFAANEDVYAEFTCNAPQALTAGRYTAGSTAETIFCEGVYYHFAAGEGKTAAEIIKNGTFTQYASENFHFADDWEKIKNGNGDEYSRSYQPFIAQAVTASFVEDSRMTEQTVILSGTDSRNAISGGDMVDLDIFWMYKGNGTMVEEKTNPLYVDTQDEDDNGTLITLCALNTDNDSISLQYEGKDVGWSDPAVQSVILTPPYWSELDYGSAASTRGTTSYDVTVSNTAGVTDSGNIGLSLGFSFSGGVDIFGNGGKLGVSGELAGNYAHTFQSANTHTNTISFSSGGGTDYVCLTVTPVAMYNYKVYMPEHTATEEEIEASGGTIAAGDRVPAATQDMAVSVQLNPVSSAIPLDTYNRVIENYNQNETNDQYKLKTIDINELYPGMKTGDPTTYASDISGTNADLSDTVGTQVSSNYANVGMTEQSSMTLSMSDTHSETTTNGYTVNVKGAFNQTVQMGVKFLFFDATSTLTFSEGLSDGYGQTWSTTNSTTTQYRGFFPALPASAQTGTTITGDPSSAYSFSSRLAKWDSLLANAAPSINMENGDTVNNKIAVIGYLVEGTDGAPPAQPTDLRVAATTESSAVLAWTNPSMGDRHPASYKVYYAKSLSDTFQPVKRLGEDLIVDAAQNGCLVTGLNANTTYYFRLEAYAMADAQGNKSVLGPYATGKTKTAGLGVPIIDTPPVDIYAQVGDTPFFTIAASSSVKNAELTYQWQQLKMQNYGISFVNVNDEDGDENKKDPTFNPAYYTSDGTITPSDVATLDQSIYRCVVTETKAGNDYQSITSRCATLHIGEGQDTSVTLAVPESQEAILSYDQDGTEVTVKSGTAFNLTGQLTTATPDNQDLRIHVVDNTSQTQIHLFDTRADATSGAYNQTLGADDLAPGSYTLITTYGGDGDNAASCSNIVDINVLDAETEYTITYNLDGGTNSINNPSLYTVATVAITLEEPTKYGATFEGWYKDAAFTKKIETIDCVAEAQNITLYAKWTNIPYVITYNLDGGTNASTNPATYTVADTLTLDAPTKDGFTFEGWYKDAELTQPTSGISQGTTGDQSFYTKWTAIAPDIPAPVDPDAQGDYPISNYDELVAVANAVAADPDRYATANYYLTGNIIASGKAWDLAIGSEAKPFIGQFDGRNYYILGLVPGTGVRGLFDTIGSGGTVSNLSVIDMDFSEAVNIAGGIAAINKGTIDSCGSGVNISSGGTYFKDGQSVPLTELNSIVKGEVAGGLVGDNLGTILNSRNNATVIGSTVGGIAGRNTGTIANVFNTGAITASTSGGGIVGTLTAMGNLSHGYNVGTLTASGELTAQSDLVPLGAIAGTLQNENVVGFYYPNTMANAYGDPQSTSLGAVAMEPSAMATQAFTDQLNSDITDLDLKAWTWRASDNGGYPRIEKTVLVSTVIKDLHLKVTDDEPTPSPSTVNPSAPSPGGSGSSGASGNGSTPASTLSGNTATGIAGGGALAFVLGLCLTAAATIILYRRKEVKHDK